MNPIAEAALASALSRGLSPARSTPRPVLVYSTAEPTLDVSDINTHGPINQVMRAEGKKFALDMIRDAGESLSNTAWTRQLVQVLIRAAIGRPSSFALGMKDIIEMMGNPK